MSLNSVDSVCIATLHRHLKSFRIIETESTLTSSVSHLLLLEQLNQCGMLHGYKVVSEMYPDCGSTKFGINGFENKPCDKV